MKFINRIKELTKDYKKIKLKDLSLLERLVYFFPILPIAATYNIYSNAIHMFLHPLYKEQVFVSVSILLIMFAMSIASFVLSKEMIKDFKCDKLKVSDKDRNDFILTFPEDFREIVIKKISETTVKKGYFSVLDLKSLDKNLTLKELKSYKENEFFTKFLTENKMCIIDKKIINKEKESV